MKVLAGEQVLIGFHGQEALDVAMVIDTEGNRATLAVQREGCVYGEGCELTLLHRSDDWRGRAVVASVESTTRITLLYLENVAAEGRVSRARRHEYALNVAADYLSDAENLKRTIGHTSNLSRTGVRVRLRSPLKRGTAARLVIRVGTDQSVEVLARVVRIIAGSESSGGGYDVAFHFERVLSGYEWLCEVAPETSASPVPVGPSEDPDDWFSTPEAV